MRWHKDRQDPPPAPVSIGAPIAGTERSVELIDRGLEGGCPGLLIADRCFDSDVFVAWGLGLYHGVLDAWRTRSASELRPVMTAVVRDLYTQYLLALSALPQPRSMMATAEVDALLVGGNAGDTHHNVVVEFDLALLDKEFCRSWDLSENERRWWERWLFQRPHSTATPVAGAIDVCDNCGAPVPPGAHSRCTHCDADISDQTGGWQVTRVETTMPAVRDHQNQLAQIRTRSSAS